MRENLENLAVTHKEKLHRFEAEAEGQVAILEYELSDGVIAFTHTLVPPQIEGRGVGNKLAHAALEHAQAEQLTVIPACSFVAAYVRRHPEYQTLVAPEHRASANE